MTLSVVFDLKSGFASKICAAGVLQRVAKALSSRANVLPLSAGEVEDFSLRTLCLARSKIFILMFFFLFFLHLKSVWRDL